MEGLVQHQAGQNQSSQHQISQQEWQPLQPEQLLCPGDSVRVGHNSRAALHLRNNSFVRLDADTVLSFPAQKSPAQENSAHFWVELQQGIAHFISRIVHRFEVATPYVNAVVEGTEFIVSAQQQGAVSVMEGKVTAYNEKSRTSLTAGQQATAAARDQDLSRFNVPASSVVEWAIHYPPILTLADLPAQTEQDKTRLQAAIHALQQNRIDQALATLETNPPSEITQLARATLLLQLGQLPEFNRTLQPLLQGQQSGLAYGLKAISDIARNETAAGRASADEAVKRAPGSAASWVALSYAQQAELQLDDALKSAKQGVQVQPSSVLAHLRLSELYLVQGDVDAARDALDAIPETAQLSAEREGSKGFVQLFRLKLDSAREHFERALAMDSSNPHYQLGLGLTLLRDGDLETGRQHIEYAVSLDPLRSVLRSYLGRAYFEEKRDDEAIKQWDLAKQFDPNDPTPYFYTGVHKLFANDPVGAINELETSRDLNDRRAVYRSETLLQSDAASRSATLARAYNEVGYEQGVLLNGWDAIRRDPTSAEGHRLLSDHYAGDSRYESARVSELLQSQLWQPLSAYPLQPQLNEANIALVEGSGPQRPGLNEYHSLFTQDGVYGMANGYGGSDGTWGDDLVGSFLAGPVAVSLGQYHFESDGWRENADQEQDIYNGLVQWQIGSMTSVQYEHRNMTWDRGFLTPTVGVAVDLQASEKTDRVTDRIGIVHRYSQNGAVLLSVINQNWEVHSGSTQDIGPIDFHENSDSLSTELQWVASWGRHSLNVGAGYIDIDTSDAFNQSISADLGGFLYTLDIDRNVAGQPKIATGYADYLYRFGQGLDFGAGLGFYDWDDNSRVNETQTEYIDGVELGSVTEADRLDNDKTAWLPRLGVAYRPVPSLQVRAAGFYSIAKPLAAIQSIEATNFFGFNKVYDDFERTVSRNYAFGVDGLSDAVQYGVSFVERHLRVPEEGVDSDSHRDFSVKIIEIYTSFQPSNLITVSMAAEWSKQESRGEDALLFSSITSIDQYKFPLRFAWHGKSGVSFVLDQSYFVQDVETLSSEHWGRDNTWITDAMMQFRMPRRMGEMSVGVKNLFGEQEEYLGFSGRELAFYPERFLFVAINVNY